MSSFPCSSCGENHIRQIFISHASRDEEIAQRVARASCNVKVASYLFELSTDIFNQDPPADDIAEQVAASEAVFVVLGEAVSGVFWTQAWIGFEIGVMKGVNIANRMKSPYPLSKDYFSNPVIVIQDIKQGIEVSIPRLDALFLFDFDSNNSWNEYEGMVSVLSRIAELDTFFKIGERFKQSTMKANVKCEYCKSQYEAWITIEDAPKLDKAFNQFSKIPVVLAECTIECPSCDKMVTRVFRQALGVKRSPHTFMSSTTNFLRRTFLRIFSRRK